MLAQIKDGTLTPEQIEKKNAKRDLREIIQMTLDSPMMKEGEILNVDGKTSIEEFKYANMDVKTRIVMQVSMDAMKGDIKAAEWLMRYGGLEPPKEQTLHIELPTIIDDMAGGEHDSDMKVIETVEVEPTAAFISTVRSEE